MNLVEKAMDYGNAADIFCNGVARIDEVAPGVVRLAFYSTRKECHEEEPQNVIVGYQLWTAPQLLDTLNALTKAWKDMKQIRGQPNVVQLAGMH